MAVTDEPASRPLPLVHQAADRVDDDAEDRQVEDEAEDREHERDKLDGEVVVSRDAGLRARVEEQPPAQPERLPELRGRELAAVLAANPRPDDRAAAHEHHGDAAE